MTPERPCPRYPALLRSTAFLASAAVLATAVGVAPQAFLYAYLIREAPQSAWAFYAVSWLVIGVIGSAALLRRKSGPAIPAPDREVEPVSEASAGECKAA